MRLTSFGLIGLMVISALFWSEQLTVQQIKTAQLREHYIELVLAHAAEDAVNVTRLGADNYAPYDNLTLQQPKLVIETFISSLAQSLNMTAQGDLIRLSSYIPYIALVDSAGYYVYAVSPGSESGYQYQRTLLPRIDFVHKIDQYYIFLDGVDNIKIMYFDAGQWRVEYRQLTDWLDLIDNQAVRQFLSAPNYDQRIKQLKLEQLEADLSYIVNLHNQYAHARGLYYDFTFEPVGDSWTGVVERPTLLAALQGVPLSNSDYFDQIISANYTITRDEQYYGFSYNGVKYYAKQADIPADSTLLDDVFYSPQDAAKKGYYPYVK